MNNPLGVSPSKGKQGTTRGKEKNLFLTSVGIEPTTSGLDLPLLCRLSYKVAQRKSGTILELTSELTLVPLFVFPVLRGTTFIIMYPYFLFAAIHHLKSSPTFSVRPCSSVGRVTEDLIRRSWVRFPPRSKKDIFFASCGSLFPFTRANAQWVIRGFM